MYRVAEVVARIRRRRGQTLTEFSKQLGVSASAISQYESGKIRPTDALLLRLLQMTEEELEKKALLQALGISAGITGPADEDQLVEACAELREYFEIVQREGGPRDREITDRNAAEELIREVAQIANDKALSDPVLVEILRFWRRHGSRGLVKQSFREFAAYLEVQIKLMETRESRPKRGGKRK